MKEYIIQAIAQETIDSFEALNAPELVRCKDCKHYDVDNLYCDKHDFQFDSKLFITDWFCGDGKRRG